MTNVQTKAAVIALCAAAGLGVASAAWADASDIYFEASEGAVNAIQKVDVGLGEAIDAAQSETGSHAIAAKLEPVRGEYAYAVELVGPEGAQQQAFVDPTTGDVSLEDPYYPMEEEDGDADDAGTMQ